MLNISGAERRFCDGISRRDFLRIGSLGSAGLALPELLRQRAGATAMQSSRGDTGKAKSCILLFMNGGPSQLGTFDLKPDAPAEVRGDPADIVATIYHCLGIDSETEITDHLGRSLRLCLGTAIQPLLS